MRKITIARMLALLSFAAAANFAHAQYPKLDAALSDLIDAEKAKVSRQARTATPSPDAPTPLFLGITDANDRILVDIYLDGAQSIDDVVQRLKAAGAEVTGVNREFSFGTISAFIPTSSLIGLTVGDGVRLMKMTRKPQRNAGVVNSQGTVVIRSDLANASGYSGSGITVGVLSDSYDATNNSFTTIHAANDIASGDLKPPKFVIDLAVAADNTDEGRAMMQIVQDVAPGSDLCFATAFAGEAAFASNIRTLRTNPTCAADVIVDDVFYFDEPFFSDGQVAQAVNDVVTSSVLAGKKVAYFSSAGNQGASGGGGAIDVPNATFSLTPTGLGNINLATTAACASSPTSGSTKADTTGGWLNFGGGTYAIPLNYNAAGSTMIMQWDDLFYQSAVTTDLNLYFFNASGNCVFTFASNNISADNGIEVAGLGGGGSQVLRIMIARTGAGTHQASRVRLVSLEGYSGGPLAIASGPTTFGHSAAANANSVAAYRYTSPASQTSPFIPRFESFSSPGPVTIAFDAANNRLAVAETRKKPDMAAPDGGDTTFFYPGSDFEGNGRPNFFGTSAAAPHAAGVAALLLQKAGGPNTLTPKQIKSIMQTSAPARVIPVVGGAPTKIWSLYDGFGLIDAVNGLNKLP
jgi:hypothetical protein